jgi:protein-tyrosine phosphatase
VKLKDGLFFGDVTAAQDIDFVSANKVRRIINCACRQVPNLFTHEVEYLSYTWQDNDVQEILDRSDHVVNEACRFIDEVLDRGESVLVHSYRGKSRCVTLLTAYLMKKYRWTANKALQYIQSRRKDIGIKPAFHRQLLQYERRLRNQGRLTDTWEFVDISPDTVGGYNAQEDLILCNTYLNSQGKRTMSAKADSIRSISSTVSSKRIVWRDAHADDRNRLERDSDSSGKVYLRNSNVPITKSILKHQPIAQPPIVHRIQLSQQEVKRSPSPMISRAGRIAQVSSPKMRSTPSTAESTPVLSGVVPLNLFSRPQTPTRRMELSRAPSPQRFSFSSNPSPYHSFRPPSPVPMRFDPDGSRSRPVSGIRPPSPLQLSRPTCLTHSLGMNRTLSRAYQPSIGQLPFALRPR